MVAIMPLIPELEPLSHETGQLAELIDHPNDHGLTTNLRSAGSAFWWPRSLGWAIIRTELDASLSSRVAVKAKSEVRQLQK
jgi:hypothetical protein